MLRSVAIDITNHCNLNCIHCLRDKLSERAHLDLEILDTLLKEMNSLGILETSLTGGEPALHPELRKIFEMHLRYGIFFSLVSNGYLFKEKIYPLISDNVYEYLTGVCFSLDGPEAYLHDRIRGKGSFKRVIESIKLCIKDEIPVSIKSIIYRENMKTLADTAILCSELGVEQLGFVILTPTPKLLAEGLLPSKEEYEDIIEFIKAQIKPSFSIQIDIEGYADPEFKVPFCNPAYGLSIDHLGNLIFCCNLSHPTAGDRPDSFGKEYLGNIREIGLEEGILRHYRLFSWFIKKILSNQNESRYGSNCVDCFRLFGKLDWLDRYESTHN